jgi:hypothetical protein
MTKMDADVEMSEAAVGQSTELSQAAPVKNKTSSGSSTRIPWYVASI